MSTISAYGAAPGMSSCYSRADSVGWVGSPTTWPFVGRTEDIATVLGVLAGASRPSAVQLVGPMGIGKSQVATRAVDQLLDTRPQADVVRLRASNALAGIALGAAAPLLGRCGVGGADLSEVLTAVHAAVDASSAPWALLVDDAPRLDPASAAVLEQLLARTDVRAVLTSRDGEPLAPGLAHLLDDATMVTCALEPLTEREAADAVELSMGAELELGTRRELFRLSGGNPLMLRELVQATTAAKGFRVGAHGLELSQVVVAARIVDLVEERFAHLRPDERELLEVLAVAQPVPLQVLPADTLASLEAAGCIVIVREGDRDVVHLAHPVHEQVLRSGMAELRRRARSRAAADLLMAAGEADAAHRAVRLMVAAGARPPVDDVVTAARRALGLLDQHGARELALAAIDGGATFWGHLVLGAAASASGDRSDAVEALDRARSAASGDEQLALATHQLGMHLALREEDPAGACDVTEAALACIDAAEWQSYLAADLAKWRMMTGRSVDDLLPDGAPLPVLGEDVPPEVILNDCVIRALVAVMAGDLDVAEAAVAEGLPLAIASPEALPNAQELLLLSRYLCHSFAGRLDDAAELATSHLQQSPTRRGEPEGMWAYALSVLDLHRGCAGLAAQRAQRAVELLAWRDFTGLRPVARAVHATALAQLARFGDAEAVLSELPADAAADPKVAMQRAQAQAWRLVADRRPDDAARLLADAGCLGVESGHRCLAALTSYEAVRLGRADLVLDALAASADAVGGELLPTLAAHARAAVARDARALEAASRRLEALGLLTGAADAAAQAAAVHRRVGRGEAARRGERRATALCQDLDGARGSAGSDPDVALTPRERQVVMLAVRRFRSREISNELGIAVRTVDNHLASAYRKLGVTNRLELAEVVAELGLVPGDDAPSPGPVESSRVPAPPSDVVRGG